MIQEPIPAQATVFPSALPDAGEVWRRYRQSAAFKQRLGLYDTVRENENFFIGNQWEGVQSNGLPTPVFNFLKRAVMYQVASITSDNIAARVSAALCTDTRTKAEIERIAQVVNEQITQIMERNALPALLQAYARNAAVDGDACLYTWFDPAAETGQAVRGEIVTELVENTRVHFGDSRSREVQTQPWILLSRRLPVEEVRWRAAKNSVSAEECALIRPDGDCAEPSEDDERVTLLSFFRRDRETGHIWQMECTEHVTVRAAVDTELTRYPITWLCWDYVQDCMHGQASVTGLKPNQMFINRIFAMTMLSLMTTAYPKILYDKTRLPGGWDSRVGAAIAVNGGDMSEVARIMEPAQISPQVAQFIKAAVDYTQGFLGTPDVSLGTVRPENASAIIALQRASNTPLELTRQSLYRSVEELCLIYIDQMRAFYGVRRVEQTGIEGAAADAPPFGVREAAEARFLVDFDFKRALRGLPMAVRVDVGASSYWSEIASMQTLDNLLAQGKIDLLAYLERVPAGYIPKKQALIDRLRSEAQTKEEHV